MRIEVTAEDIAAGKRGNCYRCPIALAVRRATGRRLNVDGVCVGMLGRTWACLPVKAERWIERFDAGRPVRPFSFMLTLLEAR